MTFAHRMTAMGLAAMLSLAVGASAWSQGAGQNPAGKPGGEKLTDQEFTKKASETDVAEIGLGQLAAQKASSPQVKQFGQKMVEDHTMSRKMLAQIAASKNLPVVNEMDAKHKELYDKLQGLQGAQFDQVYMKNMVAGHEKAIKLYQQQAQHGSDPALKDFAAKSLPTLNQHYQHAQQIAKALNGGDAKQPR